MFNFKAWLHGLKLQRDSRHSDGTVPAPAASSEYRNPVNGHNDFALGLYERLSHSPGNVFFSPLSVRVACAMASVGARGETATQMNGVLGFPVTGASNQVVFVELIQRLGTNGKEYELNSANALWSQAGAPLEPEFVELMSRLYYGHVNTVDFRGGDIEAARADINRWVKEKTNQRIPELVPAGGMNADTRLALVNAVYFKGMWLEPFDKFDTRDGLFYPEDGAPIQVPLMSSETNLRYTQGAGFQAVELNYKGGDLSMLVLLPEKNRLRDFEAQFSVQFLEQTMRLMSFTDVEIFLPRFKMTRDTELSSPLSALGMPLAFAPGSADFSGINGHEPPHEDSLFISKVFHQAMVEVNEEGTEAAAATAAVALAFSIASEKQSVPVFRADRPFLFAIRDKVSGAILFLGRVNNPA